MSKDDPNFKRLSTIIVLFVFVFILSISQAVLLHDNEGYVALQSIDPNMPPPESASGLLKALYETDPDAYAEFIRDRQAQGMGVDIVLDIVGFFFGSFFLKIVELPLYMSVVITPIYIILLLVFWYIILDFIKDIEILGTSI